MRALYERNIITITEFLLSGIVKKIFLYNNIWSAFRPMHGAHNAASA